MTKTQIAWAATHDWFVADNGDGTIEVLDAWSDGSATTLRWDRGFRALREWAGY